RFSRDWSSDVCSSDLVHAWADMNGTQATLHINTTVKNYASVKKTFSVVHSVVDKSGKALTRISENITLLPSGVAELSKKDIPVRSEERRVGKASRPGF